MDSRKRELDIATNAVRLAADLCAAVAADPSLEPVRKGDASPVTAADFGSQALICRALSSAFPEDHIVAEESPSALLSGPAAALLPGVLRHVRHHVTGAREQDVLSWIGLGARADGAERFWTLDPIDGTKGYIRGAQYAVALALIEDGRPVVACLACPRLELDGHGGVLLSAVSGSGALLTSLDGSGSPRALSVREGTDAENARFCESVDRGHSSRGVASRIAERIGMRAPPIRMDSQAKYAVVAHGDADFYLRIPRGGREIEYIWDHAAGSLVVEEAGGRVSDMDGSVLDFGHGSRLLANRGVVASNGSAHEAVLTALESIDLPD